MTQFYAFIPLDALSPVGEGDRHEVNEGPAVLTLLPELVE